MTLIKSINSSIKSIFKSEPLLEKYKQISIRNYLLVGGYAEYEIFFYPCKWWDKHNGGNFFGELYCLVPEVQKILYDTDQSLAKLDYTKPISYYQYRTDSKKKIDSAWKITSLDEIDHFKSEVRDWLINIGLKWFDNFTDFQSVVDYLAERESYCRLAELLAKSDRKMEAINYLYLYLRTLPRMIEKQLNLLCECALIGIEDKNYLYKASIQSEDQYKKRLDYWIQNSLKIN